MAVEQLTINDEQLLDKLGSARELLLREIRKAIIGQDDVVEQVLLSLFVGGHSIITGVPGLAKTLLVRTISSVLDLSFKRIQFTPDLMPADITGTEIIEEDRATGRRAMQFIRGPIFANIVLADEINRTPPKTQAALLEAMQEGRVTVQGVSYDLPRPFHVLATQNPYRDGGHISFTGSATRSIHVQREDRLSAGGAGSGRRSSKRLLHRISVSSR
jgi:MoxR-like ATPase